MKERRFRAIPAHTARVRDDPAMNGDASSIDVLIAALARLAVENYKREESHRNDVSRDSKPERSERGPLQRTASGA